MNYHQKSIKERKIGESHKCKRETIKTILQSLVFSISSKANDAANQADNIVASMVVDVEAIMVGYRASC